MRHKIHQLHFLWRLLAVIATFVVLVFSAVQNPLYPFLHVCSAYKNKMDDLRELKSGNSVD